MTIGDIKLPNRIPNLNQILFNGVKIFEFKSPKIKKIIAIIKDQIIIFSSLNNGNIEIIKKKRKKNYSKTFICSNLNIVIFHIKLVKVA